MISIDDFCENFSACSEGREWAIANCKTMDDAWAKAKPEWLVWLATRPSVCDEKTLRIFACWSVKQIWHLLTDKRSKNAVEVAERFALGEASEEQFAAAGDASMAATWNSAWDASRAAAWAARDARDSARAAWDVGAATWDSAGDASMAARAAWDSALAAQAKWLRENAKPNFELGVKK